MKKLGTILAPERFMTGALLMNREIYDFLKDKIDIAPIVPEFDDYLKIKNIGTILYYFSTASEAKKYQFVLGTSVATLGFLDQTKVIQHFHGVDSVGHQLVLDDYYNSSEEKLKVIKKWQEITGGGQVDLKEIETNIAISKEVEKICCQKSYSIIVVSPLVKDQLVDKIGADPSKITVILNGLPEYWFTEGDEAFVDQPELIYTTRASKSFYNLLEKGQDRAYEIFSKVDLNKKAYIHLSGFTEAEKNTYTDKLKTETTTEVYKNKQRAELKRSYKPGQIFLSTSRTESFNLSLAEAMACKMIPVCYPTGLVKSHIVHGKNGFIVHSTEEAIDIINKLASDKEMRQEIGNNAYLTAKKFFTYNRMLAEYEETIKSIIKG